MSDRNLGAIALPPELKSRVLAAALREPAPTRRTVRVQSAFWLGAVSALLGALAGIESHFLWHGRPPLAVVMTSSGWAIVALFATWVGVGPGRAELPGARFLIWRVPILLPLGLLAWTLCWCVVLPEGPCRNDRWALLLPDSALTLAALPAVAVALWKVRADLLDPAATGAALATAMGGWSGCAVSLSCPSGQLSHILLEHFGPLVVLVLGGYAIGHLMKKKIDGPSG